MKWKCFPLFSYGSLWKAKMFCIIPQSLSMNPNETFVMSSWLCSGYSIFFLLWYYELEMCLYWSENCNWLSCNNEIINVVKNKYGVNFCKCLRSLLLKLKVGDLEALCHWCLVYLVAPSKKHSIVPPIAWFLLQIKCNGLLTTACESFLKNDYEKKVFWIS